MFNKSIVQIYRNPDIQFGNVMDLKKNAQLILVRRFNFSLLGNNSFKIFHFFFTKNRFFFFKN